jgi:hypothetical protein
VNKKTFMAAGFSLLFLALVVGAGWMHEVSAVPLQLNVRLVTPWDGYVYSNSVVVEFSYAGTGFFGVVKQPTCYIYIDGNRIELPRTDQGVSLGQEYNISKPVVRNQILNVTDGDHYLSVGVDVWYNHTLVSVYNPRTGGNDWVSREDYMYGHSQVVHFTAAGSTPTPTAPPSSSPSLSPSPTTEPTPTPSPSVAEFSAWAVLPLFLTAFAVVVVLVCVKKRRMG